MDSHQPNNQHAVIQIGKAQFLVPVRLEQIELLDQGIGTLHDVRQNLYEMWYMNKLFGGVRAVTQRLYTRLLKNKTPMWVADLGIGSGRLGREISDWASQNRIDVNMLLIDISSRHLAVASEIISDRENIDLIQADALKLPFANKEIDYFVSSLFMHHFEPDMVTKLLSDLYQSVRHGIIMSDLTRSSLSLFGFRMIQPVIARHYLTKHDGLLSIRRAYTPAELLQLAHHAGIKNVHIYQDYPWQMTLVAEKSDV